MKRNITHTKGFTLVELLIVCLVIAILAVIGTVIYQNLQKRAADTTVFKDLKSAAEQLGLVYAKSPADFGNIQELPDSFRPSDDIVFRFVPSYQGDYYENLSPVQGGVLLYDICEDLIADPQFTTIHSKDGNQSQSVVMKCNDSIAHDKLQITGWQTKEWHVPVTKEDFQNYIDSVPYDNWWIDRQEVVRGFYSELVRRYEVSGGIFPITSFWDPWANQWSGIPKEELPAPSPPPASRMGAFCIEAYHSAFPDRIYIITEDDEIKAGTC